MSQFLNISGVIFVKIWKSLGWIFDYQQMVGHKYRFTWSKKFETRSLYKVEKLLNHFQRIPFDQESWPLAHLVTPKKHIEEGGYEKRLHGYMKMPNSNDLSFIALYYFASPQRSVTSTHHFGCKYYIWHLTMTKRYGFSDNRIFGMVGIECDLHGRRSGV